ncbi:MAG: proton-conducting transporter membrane subunit, partial [Chloroflexota bacterium]
MTLPYQSIICLVAGAVVILALVQPLSSRPATTAWIGALAAVGCGALGFVYASGIPQLVAYAVGGFVLVAVGLAPALELEVKEQRPEVVALLLLAGAGAIGLAAGGDLLQLAVSMETLSLSAALLVVLGRGPVLTEAAFKYFLLAAVSMASLLYGLGLVYLSTGSLAFPALSAHPSALLVGGLVLMTAGFAFELALVPLHWGALDV